jgi:AraC-like DNA-binding protein
MRFPDPADSLPISANLWDFVHTRTDLALRSRGENQGRTDMPKLASKLETPAIQELRRELASRIAAHAPAIGENETAVPGLVLFRRTTTTPCYRGAYEPSLNVFAQGRKRVNLGGTIYQCKGGSFLLSSIDVPVESQIVEASEEMPLLSMLLRLEMPLVREVLSSEELPEMKSPSRGAGIAIGETTEGLLGACIRLIELQATPSDIPYLGRLIQREIIYRMLRTPQGERLRSIATSGDLSNKTAKAISWLKANYAKPLHIEELAELSRLGVSTLHHQFRALTSMSPLQYQKQLRLHAARERMLMGGLDATSAAFEVGYESVSQFNREYSRLFGQPPMRDIKALRTGNVPALSAA